MRKYIGFGILLFFVMVLFISTLINLWQISITIFILFLLVVFFALYRMHHHFIKTVQTQKASYRIPSEKAALDFLTTFFGAMITYFISIYLGLGGVIASGLIGMLAALFIKPYAVPIFCGSFLGMTSGELMEPWMFHMAAVAAGMIFVATKDVCNGFGGKLGTIALSSALLISFVLGQSYLAAPIFNDLEMVLIIVFSILGALVTYIVNIRFEQGPVLASGLVGLFAGAILPVLFGAIGITLAIATFGASFVGMSATDKMKEESMIIFAGLLFGLIYIFSAPYFGGAGGKLGTIAFASVLSVSGLRMFLRDHVYKTSKQS